MTTRSNGWPSTPAPPAASVRWAPRPDARAARRWVAEARTRRWRRGLLRGQHGDHRAAQGKQNRFSTRPLARDMVLAGDSTFAVDAAFTADDGNIAAVLFDEAPDGAATRITAGWLKASHRRGHTALSPVTPGAYHAMDIHIWPTHYRVEAGHRLVLRVSSDDYPEIDSDVPAERVTLKVGERGAELRLRVRGDS
ncbi:CocE/NonD family hydrolase C-terminal non-catalytic domain-containing protein [Streptomyces sp. NBC_01446]|uniref:CocE/NonD family hydrolase C-terminal non-catalytic domain-containing protein n=1 Tax=Streptomyces sp. NBC_01446 TaxID=2903870 RepID=UPI00225AB699|nr:CocE/NonD family hydrolase C-terminal non-catalytic domain-containing protein [Streptomyces sp. NBC_01446]MCX4641348.1 hypothetical protein [Streptomyces sp. NBC_01446]